MEIENLKILPKKGDLSNPNNWREINFLDVVSKLMSILLTIRLQIVLKNRFHYPIWNFSKYWMS